MATSTRTEPRVHQNRGGRTINHLLAAIKWVIDLFLEALPINLAAAAVVIALRFWFGGQFTWRSFLLNVFTILLFSNCIGMLIAVSISLAARRLPSKRSLPGLLLLALLIAAAAALGCVVASSLVIVFGLYSPSAFFVIVGRSRASVRICSSTRSTRSPR